MAGRHHVVFSRSALADLEEVREWYREQGAARVGQQLVAEVVSAVERLAELPSSGRVVSEFGDPAIRELIRPPFRIVYRLESTAVAVVRVWRSERDMSAGHGVPGQTP